MSCASQIQKLCQFDTKRKILTMGMIFAVTLVFQSSLLPYGNVLLSLLSVQSVMVGKVNHLHDSNSTNSSVVLRVVNYTEGVDMDKVFDRENGTKGKEKYPNNESQLEEDQKSDSFQKVVAFDNNTKLENSVFVDDVEKVVRSDSEDTGFALEKVESAEAGLVYMHESNKNTSKTDISINSQIPPGSKQARETLPQVESPVMLQSGPITLNNNSTSKDAVTKKKQMVAVTSISEMNNLLIQSRVSSRAMRPRWPSVDDRELLSAKLQIETAPLAKNDPELYAPLYRNVSMFKKSYELMEHMLKVYIYREGEKPIFHQPRLKGIYASEGWFMKLMEGNKQFVVKDPRKAHLFYLPFSSYMLRSTLYELYSQKNKKLAEYLKNYVEMIARKYDFWNRTGGADHFLVACHDWAPQETIRSMGHCIRALCNANVARGFKLGKDVSLPVTFVRNAEDPLKSLGGKPSSRRPILAFFAGSMHGYLRPILLQYWDKDPDMQIFGPLPRVSGKMNYVQYMKSSKYCISARGYEVHTPRVIEAIFYECVPVIISDNYVPPFFEILNWKAFSVFIPEKDVPNLKNILLSIPKKKYLALQTSVKKVQKHFLWHKKPLKYDIFHMTLHSIWYNRVFQIKPK